ncbi:TATA element modulatory factor [Spodoptera frugiperda]|uniref:TATA element modulatory factor n=1 Tax=Spodoptera frugiperda TaxID=7108 RepID=A0A9R0D906_SPOFR|nr:TATA element modulatory factor [Spodoptera frugiperda]
MNWFDTSGLTSLAKNALKEAQKTIDKALDIQDESGDEPEEEATPQTSAKSSPGHSNTPQKDNSDFFSSWGLTVSAESEQNTPIKEQPVVTESPSKSTSQSIWGSFAGSFFEQPKDEESTIVRPPKAKSMNVIADSKYGSQDDLFSKSQLIMSDSEALDHRITKSLKDELPKVDERRDSAKSHRLSLVSSRNSSDSVEVLSQSLKTTPDSEASVHSISRSSSTGQKHNSESVEILPDSLVSPSSIECLGFDSYSSEKNSNSSSLCVSPGDNSDKKSTPIGDKTEKADTADSVSLVADDDEDTMSYNSISECTAPTVLDTDDKSVSPFTKVIKTDASRKVIEKELMHLEQALVPQRMQISENSSNDGSWSDRTLNADGDSINLDMTAEDQKKEQEDVLIEKLSDSSSFYNVNVSSDMLRSESSAFVNVEKQQCNESSSSSSQKDGSVKERTSPISSDSKSDLVKIGSDRTSGHTSGDELETATSSDIEIIPSPNGDGHGFRNSPAKYAFKQSKFDGTTSPNLVDLVLGKSLATKIRGHNRELSEASVQSNTSDESQGSENERLMRRLCEMAELLEARENRLLEMSRNNADLAENNADLKSQVESLMLKHEGGDINTITEDYTQRMSALEKKFQQAIREKDQLRKQLDQVKSESSSRKNSSELENTLKEKDEVIAQLQEEGEKLARQQLQHSNIIKKLRAKEKDNEQVIKGLRDKIAEQSAELDRLKRSIAAKEELEVSQIEAVYRLTTANKKLETELMETRSQLDDTQHKLEGSRASLEGARRELAELQRTSADLSRRATAAHLAQNNAKLVEQDLQRLRTELAQLREDRRAEEKKWVAREEALRRELQEAREACSALESSGGGGGGGDGGAGGAGAVLAQLAQLQAAALDRDRAHAHTLRQRAIQLAEAERALAAAVEREQVSRDECSALQARLVDLDLAAQAHAQQLHDLAQRDLQHQQRIQELQEQIAKKNEELETERSSHLQQQSQLQQRLQQLELQLHEQSEALQAEKQRAAILQEQSSRGGEVSPSQSIISDSLSASFWHSEESGVPVRGGAASALCVEDTLSALRRRDAELAALAAHRDSLLHDREQLARKLATCQAALDDMHTVQEQYDALLQMYGEKEEQMAELRLDLQDVTQLYKAQLDELIALKQRR